MRLFTDDFGLQILKLMLLADYSKSSWQSESLVKWREVITTSRNITELQCSDVYQFFDNFLSATGLPLSVNESEISLGFLDLIISIRLEYWRESAL